MKILKSSFTALLFFCIAQPTRADVFDDVVKALEEGNMQKLETYFSAKIDLELADGSFYQSNSPDLRKALAVFLSEHPAKAVSIKHRGPSGGQSFVIANYLAKDGGVYRLSLFMEGDSENMRIRELKFEKS